MKLRVEYFRDQKFDKKDISHFLMFYGTEGREVAVEMILDSQCCVSSVL